MCERGAKGTVIVCIAGKRGPALARALRARAGARGLDLETVPEGPAFDDCLVGQELISLRHITAVLREQCPWDREQRAMDIVSYTIEEVYELAEVIMEERLDDEHDELGDVLFQVYFLTRLLEEEQAGDLGSVAAEIEAKLIRRHAHIFGDDVAETAGDVRGVWERVKRDAEGREGVFHNVPSTLPALLLARKVQQRAAAVGFDWEHALEAFPKIAEEHGELAALFAGPAVGFGTRVRPGWPTSSSACATSSATCCLPPSTWRARRASIPRSPCARPATASCAGSTARPSSPPATGRQWAHPRPRRTRRLLPPRQVGRGRSLPRYQEDTP